MLFVKSRFMLWITTIWHTLRRLPITIVHIAVIWGLLFYSRIAGTDNEALFGYDLAGQFNPQKMFSSILTTSSITNALVSTFLILGCGILFEHLLGFGKYLLLIITTHIAVIITGKIVADFLILIGGVFAQASLDDVLLSPATWCAAVAWLGSRRFNTLWRRRLRLTIVIYTVTMFLYSATVIDFGRIMTVIGAVILVFGNEKLTSRTYRASQNEVRWLTGLSFFALMLGPTLAGANPSARAPLSEVTVLGWPSPEFFVKYYGLAPILYNQLPLLLCAIIAFGLTRGRRISWVLAVLSLLLTIAGQVWEALQFNDEPPLLLLITSTTPWVIGLVFIIFLPTLFKAKSPTKPFQVALIRASISAVTTVALWLIIVCLAPSEFIINNDLSTDSKNLSTLLSAGFQGSWQVFLPPVVSRLITPTLLPVSQLGFTLQQVPGIIFWIGCALILTKLIFGTPRDQALGSNAKYMRDVLKNGTGSHISWMTTWNDLRVYKHEFGYVAYHLHTTYAIALSEPVLSGEYNPEKRQQVVNDFIKYCATEGLTLAWYCVSEDFVSTLGSDIKTIKVADEAIVSTEIRGFVGKKFNDIRTARNNAKRAEIETVWTTWSELNPHLKGEVLSLSEDWLKEKTLPEMTFTLGGVEQLQDPNVSLMLGVDGDGHVHGVTSWLPVYENGAIAGYTLDFMRRDRNGFKGIIELLIAAVLDIAAEKDMAWISLSGAPLVNMSGIEDADNTQIDKFLGRLSSLLEPAYGFKSLAAFKRKFRPQHKAWLLAYSNPLHLPQIGIALTNAYLPKQPIIALSFKLLKSKRAG